MLSLPKIMVAPNGARKLKSDHPAIPITLDEMVVTAVDCFQAGASGLHLHVRDADGGHSLDADLYNQSITEISKAAPELVIQITTEAVGQYKPEQQRQVVRDVKPDLVSVSLAEMFSEGNTPTVLDFYRWCEDESIGVQHILYGQDDLTALGKLMESNSLPTENLQLLFVLGRYTTNQQSEPADLTPFLDWMQHNAIKADWALCAFGKQETACLRSGLLAGGKVRVGFENSFWNENGSIASNNAERVAEISLTIKPD